MLGSYVLLLASLGSTGVQERVSSLTGTFETLPAFGSKVLGNERDLLVYLPPQYASEPKRRFPVLYLHDGQNVFDGKTSFLPNREWRADEAAEALIRARLIEPILIVAIPNMGMERANEYLPTQVKRGSEAMGGKGDLYTRMVADEIKPMIDAKYRTKPDRGNTGVGGSSLGGVITLHMGLSRPEVFGKLLVVSPSLWWDNRLMLARAKEFKGPRPKVWLDMGTMEGPQGLRDARDLNAILQAKGWKAGRDLAYFEEGFAQHNEDAWARRMPSMLTFLFGT